MKLHFPTSAEIYAVGRHIAGWSAILSSGAAYAGLNPDQAKALVDSVSRLVNDFGTLVADALTFWYLAAPILAAVIALFAGKSASPTSQMNAVVNNSDNKIDGQIITTPEIAANVPSPKVVSR